MKSSPLWWEWLSLGVVVQPKVSAKEFSEGVVTATQLDAINNLGLILLNKSKSVYFFRFLIFMSPLSDNFLDF